MKVKVDLVEELGQVKQTQKSKFCDTLKLKENKFWSVLLRCGNWYHTGENAQW